jgi:hypothetical protein
LVGKSDLLKRQEGGPGQDGETGVDLVSLSMFDKSSLEGERIWLYQQSLHNKTSVFAYLILGNVVFIILNSSFFLGFDIMAITQSKFFSVV